MSISAENYAKELIEKLEQVDYAKPEEIEKMRGEATRALDSVDPVPFKILSGKLTQAWQDAHVRSGTVLMGDLARPIPAGDLKMSSLDPTIKEDLSREISEKVCDIFRHFAAAGQKVVTDAFKKYIESLADRQRSSILKA